MPATSELAISHLAEMLTEQFIKMFRRNHLTVVELSTTYTQLPCPAAGHCGTSNENVGKNEKVGIR